MFDFIKSQWFKDEIRSFLTTFLGFFALEAIAPLNELYSHGSITMALLLSLGGAALRSLIKSLLTLLFPKIFPPRISKLPTSFEYHK